MEKLRLCLGMVLTVCLAIYANASCASIIKAKSGSSVDIQAAVNLAKSGDTVSIPAGTFNFAGEVFAPDGIHIMGAGRDSTFLVKKDNLSQWEAMFVIDAKTGKPFIFSGITLQGRLDALQGSNRTTAVTSVKDQGLLIKGAAKNVRIYGSRFTKFLRAGIEFVGSWGTVPGTQTGVIYHNQFIDNWYSNLGYGVAVVGVPTNWSNAVALGTSNAIFVEDNYFERNRHCVTGNNGAIYVARYNTVKDNYQDAQSFDAHGLNPNWPRGTRSVEIYKNTVTNSIERWAGAGIRGGSGVVWGNTFKGVYHGVVLSLEAPPSTEPLKSYPAKDQIGYLNDLYVWGNTSSPGDGTFLKPTTNPPTSYAVKYWIQQSRDYYSGQKSGYTPYAYPHPLRALSPGS